MTDTTFTVERLLACYWLKNEPKPNSPDCSVETLRQFCKKQDLEVTDVVLDRAEQHLAGYINGDVEKWVTQLSLLAHPHILWNFMLEAVDLADVDCHLEKIAASLAEPILAYYGSMVPHFENQAHRDVRFKRMLTGVWRHKMSDTVWMRLRRMQADVENPLENLIPLEYGVDHMADSLSQEDRENDDKGRYLRSDDGHWQLKRHR